MISWTLVRHGESSANADGLLSGWQDVPLTALGKQQAKEAGQYLADREWDLILSSDLQRAMNTAKIALNVRSTLRGEPAPKIHPDKRFRERSFGNLQGLSKEKLRSEGVMNLLRQWNWDQEGVESNQALWKRLSTALLAHKNPRVLLFAHGGVIRLMLSWRNRHLNKDGSKTKIENASIHEIQFSSDEIDPLWEDSSYGKEDSV